MSTLSLDDLERKFFQEQVYPGLSSGAYVERENFMERGNPASTVNYSNIGAAAGGITYVAGDTPAALTLLGYCRKTTTDTTGPGIGCATSVSFPPGTYIGSAYIRSNRTGTIRVYVEGTATKTIPTTYANLVANTWLRVSVPITVTVAGTLKMGAFFETAGTIGDTLDITGVMIEKGSVVGAYFDGSTPDFNNGNYVWTGTAQASTSRLLVPEPVEWEQVTPDPLLEYLNLNNFNFESQVTGSRIPEGFLIEVGSNPSSGTWSWSFLMDQETGVSYVISVDVETITELNYRISSPNTSGNPNQPTYIPANTRTRVDIPVVATSTLQTNRIYFVNLGANQKYRVRGVSVVKGTQPGPFFSGNSKDSFFTGTPSSNSLTVKSRMVNTRSRSQGYLEYEYWAARSGLTPKEKFSITDHELFGLRAEHVVEAGENPNLLTIADLRLARFRRLSGLGPGKSISDYMRAYYKTTLGL